MVQSLYAARYSPTDRRRMYDWSHKYRPAEILRTGQQKAQLILKIRGRY